ncbi:MAG TPA: metallophosphoesterase family protein [Allocoleopsis sp.]
MTKLHTIHQVSVPCVLSIKNNFYSFAHGSIIMRTAFISDIHGNLPALKIVLDDIKNRHINRVICLGDLVEGGNYNNEVVELIKKHEYLTIQGNHDEFNLCDLKKENQIWLNQLPEEIIENDTIFTHISPRPERKVSISNNIEAWNVFDERDFRLCFIGHLHWPVIFGYECENFAESQEYVIEKEIFKLDMSDRYIICFGAVGYPRGGGKFIRYGIFDLPNYQLEFIKLQGELLPFGLCK